MAPRKSIEPRKAGADIREVYAGICQEHNVVPDAQILKFVDGKGTCELTHFDCSKFMLPKEAIQMIADLCTRLPYLEYVDLSDTFLKSESVEMLCKMASTHPTLSSLSLARNPSLGFPAAKHLMTLIRTNKRIVEIDVSGTSMNEQTVKLLTETLERNRCTQTRNPIEPHNSSISRTRLWHLC